MILKGSVGREGDIWRVRARLEDSQSGFTLWAEEFERRTGEEGALRDAVAVQVADAAYTAMEAVRGGGAKLDPRTLALVIRGSKVISGSSPGAPGEGMRLHEQVVASAPGFGPGRAILAMDMVAAGLGAPAVDREGILGRGEAAALRAVRADPRTAGPAFEALYYLHRERHPQDLAGAEDFLLKGIDAGPEIPWIKMRECRLLMEVGRTNEALRYCERARVLRPLAAPIDWAYAKSLYFGGQFEAARKAIEEAARFHPEHAETRRLHFEIEAFFGSPVLAKALLHNPEAVPSWFTPEGNAALDLFLTARQSGRPEDADRAIAALRSLPRHYVTDRYLALAAARLGRSEAAFEALGRLGGPPAMIRGFWPGVTSEPALAPLRSDVRYWKAAARAGYVSYWRTRNIWPDFCRDPAANVDCKALAARAISGL
jgi:tetratricopeptide (TPR) repeat protein